MSDGDPPSPTPSSGDSMKEYLLRMMVETVDIYTRSSAGISAEVGLEAPLPVEALMLYCLSIPAVEDLIHGFIRGDLTMFSLADQTRQLVERDTRRLELDPATVDTGATASTRLGRALAERNRQESEVRVAQGQGSELEKFIHENPEVLRQVETSSREFLVKWVMLYLMLATKARERGHRVAHEYWSQTPELCQRIQALVAQQSQSLAQRPWSPANKPQQSQKIRPF
jgi:hypothetical protein